MKTTDEKGEMMATRQSIPVQVRRFAKDHGLSVSTKGGVVWISDKNNWGKVFDDFSEAYKFIRDVYNKKRDEFIKYPWENPIKKTRVIKVIGANPVKRHQRPKVLYNVWTAAADGIKHERIALFEKLNDAKKYAQEYADSSGKKMIIETKKL